MKFEIVFVCGQKNWYPTNNYANSIHIRSFFHPCGQHSWGLMHTLFGCPPADLHAVRHMREIGWLSLGFHALTFHTASALAPHCTDQAAGKRFSISFHWSQVERPLMHLSSQSFPSEPSHFLANQTTVGINMGLTQ